MLLQILSLDPFAKTNISENLDITSFAKISSRKKSLAKIILVMIARTVLYQNQTTVSKQEA